jgi:phosphoglycolate phosphatase-like HAD superfamily hydrolase
MQERPTMNTIAFDVDGTLCDVERPIDYDDPESVRQRTTLRPWTAELVRALEVREDVKLGIVTGRTQRIRPVTRDQIQFAGIRPSYILHQPEWNGYTAMTEWKAEALEFTRADVYVGDHEADRQAAIEAGIPFVDVHGLGVLVGEHATAAREVTALG